MPLVRVDMLEGRTQQVKEAIARDMTELLVRHLGSDPSHIQIIFSSIPHADWAWAGKFFDTPAVSKDG